jgi:putative transposase
LALSRDDKAALIEHLRRLRDEGTLTAPTKQAAATLLGCSIRHLYRLLAQGAPTWRWPGYSLTEADRELYVSTAGSATAMCAVLAQEGGRPVPSLRTLQRALARELSATERGDARRGSRGRRDAGLHLREEPLHRNEEWQADHVQANLLVRGPHGNKLLRPWITWFQDAKTRAIMGWAVSIVAATSADVLAALRSSVAVDPDRGPFGGVPHLIRHDHGKEFLAAAVEQGIVRLGAGPLVVAAWSPNQKGKIERLHRTLNEEFLRGKPGWTDGPRNLNGTLRAFVPWTLERFVAELDAWIDHYNRRRPHRQLQGQTPLEAWNGDLAPLRLRSDEELARVLTASETRIVQKDGVHFRTRIYACPALHGLRGETVEIAFMPHDPRQIVLYRRGEPLGRRRPAGPPHRRRTPGDPSAPGRRRP